MAYCKTLYLNSLIFFISVITMKSHGVEWFFIVLCLALGIYLIGFIRVPKGNVEIKLTLSDFLMYSFLGRLFDKVLIRQSYFLVEFVYVCFMAGVFYISVIYMKHFELALIISLLTSPIFTIAFTKLGFFKFFEVREDQRGQGH